MRESQKTTFDKHDWFVEYVESSKNVNKRSTIINRNNYLAGNHKIKNKSDEVFNGKLIEAKKLITDYPNTITKFHTNYLYDKNVRISGEENIAHDYAKVYERGNFHGANTRVTYILQRHGEVYEYCYSQDGVLKPHILLPENSFPYYNRFNEMEAFVYSYHFEGSTYYDVYYPDYVESYVRKKESSNLKRLDQRANASGMLPYEYKLDSYTEDGKLEVDVDKIKNLVDEYEAQLSKNSDAVYKFLSGLLITKGQTMDKPLQMSKDSNGNVIALDDNGDAQFISNPLNTTAVKEELTELKERISEAGLIPIIALGTAKADNISEETIRQFYKLADIKAAENIRILKNGFNQRHKAIRSILDKMGKKYTDDEFESLKTIFQTKEPNNYKEQAENMKIFYDTGAMSVESMVEQNPYVTNKKVEMERIRAEKSEREQTGKGEVEGK